MTVVFSLVAGNLDRINPVSRVTHPAPAPSAMGTTHIHSPCSAGRLTAGTLHWAKVARVSDGDTIVITHVKAADLLTPEIAATRGEEIRIRLWGIDAPEKAQTHGEEATDRLARRLPVGSVIAVNKVTEDKYGRWVAVVGTDTRSAATNYEVVEFGDAYHWAVYDAADNGCLAAAEATAAAGAWGVWGPHGPEEKPWEYRRSN